MTTARTMARKKGIPPDASLSTHNGFSLISDEKLLGIYATMLKCRMLSQRISEHVRRNGAEAAGFDANEKIAAVAGALIDLQARDLLAPSRGGFLPCFVKGLPPAAVLAKVTGAGSAGRLAYASFNVISPRLRVAAQIDRVVTRIAEKNRGRDRRAAVIFCGGFDVSAKELENAMRRARGKKLPIVFVCWSDSADAGAAERAQSCGLAGVAVDGKDAVAIYRVATEAIAHARRGSGPTVIDCKPWPAKGRSARNKANDPIPNMESYLRQKKLLSRRFKAQVIADFKRELDARNTLIC